MILFGGTGGFVEGYRVGVVVGGATLWRSSCGGAAVEEQLVLLGGSGDVVWRHRWVCWEAQSGLLRGTEWVWVWVEPLCGGATLWRSKYDHFSTLSDFDYQ